MAKFIKSGKVGMYSMNDVIFSGISISMFIAIQTDIDIDIDVD